MQTFINGKVYKTCPFLSISQLLSNHMGVNNKTVLCVESECALWDEQNQCCSFNCKSQHNIQIK